MATKTTVKSVRKKAPKAPPPTPEAVAARLLGLFASDETPALWKEADLKRRLTAPERPALAEALTRLREERRVLSLSQGKTTFYLFAEPLRTWLGTTASAVQSEPAPGADAPIPVKEDVFSVYARLVRQSGGFPDVKIAALRAAVDPFDAPTLSERLLSLWREGRATFSQGDWSLADETTRASAVELSGEHYLLVRLEETNV